NWAVIENNRINSYVIINHGTSHVMCRNNLVKRNDWACFIVEGWDETYKRGNSDITIINNTGMNKGARGSFLRVQSKVDGLTLRNNLYIAPNLKQQNDTGAVWVDDKDLSSFRAIANNVWPAVMKGANYVSGMGGFVTADKWTSTPGVKEDRFETL